MDFNLICSLSLFIVAFAFYMIHKLWYKDVTENNKLSDFQVKAGSFKAWMYIIMIIIVGIVFFFKAIS